MTIMPIRVLGDPVLKAATQPVETFDRSLRTLCDDMLETMYDAPGVGLAAPQIGLSLRLFVYDDGRGSGSGIVANPELSPVGEETIEDEEGCLSIPGIFHVTRRAYRVLLTGQDGNGKPLSLEGEELLARVFQHETDHLGGLLYIDRLSAEDRRQVMAELRLQELEPERRRFRRSQ
ncbi:MAG TPA: peptide deformylase [Actinobacteria bacterium]|nr:peptide deformylase [Actinomycetota bacterium]HCP62559.1 peptide deformylase [Actinomycetota bacterium]